MSKQSYSYVVLRYVHDPVADESVNVGVMVHVSSTNFLKARTRTTIGRLRKFFPDLDGEAFKRAMRNIETGVDRAANEAFSTPLFPIPNVESIARIVLPNDDSGLRWSRVGVGLTDNPAVTLEKLFQRFVARHDEATDKRRGDDDVWRPIFHKLSAYKIADRFEQKTIHGSVDEITLKHAWKNGIWHAVEPISLDLSDSESVKTKARRWLGHLSSVDGLAEIANVHLIVGKPADESLSESYHDALAILRKAPAAHVVEEEQVDTVIDMLTDEIAAHEAGEKVKGSFGQGTIGYIEDAFFKKRLDP